MNRFDELITTVEDHQALAAENYDRIRKLSEELRSGLCEYMDAKDGVCVHLVPPGGEFKPKAYGDKAYSIPPRGFRPLGPIAFGLAVRVSRGTDWLRLTLECRKIGESFIIQIINGPEYQIILPLSEHDPEPFYELIYEHLRGWFSAGMERYQEGEYGSREIGFDIAAGTDKDKT